MKKKPWQPWLLLSPSLTAILLLLVVPVCFVVVYSFWLRAPSGQDIPAFQMGNYAKFFADFFYPSILLKTIRVAVETVLLCLVMGYIPAYFFYKTESRFKPFLMLSGHAAVLDQLYHPDIKLDQYPGGFRIDQPYPAQNRADRNAFSHAL